jgi:hypothetical protein
MRFRISLGAAAGSLVFGLTVAHWVIGSDDTNRIQAIPLGLSLEGQSGERCFGAYVPTRFGGVLTVTTTAGKVGRIVGPEGRERASGEDVGKDAQGWYTFTVTGADKPYTVETSFVQVGQSARKPWNFYYWPTKADAIHEPWAEGNGRVDTMQAYGDDILVATPGGYIPPGRDIVRAGPNGLLETPVAPGDDSTLVPQSV